MNKKVCAVQKQMAGKCDAIICKIAEIVAFSTVSTSKKEIDVPKHCIRMYMHYA